MSKPPQITLIPLNFKQILTFPSIPTNGLLGLFTSKIVYKYQHCLAWQAQTTHSHTHSARGEGGEQEREV